MSAFQIRNCGSISKQITKVIKCLSSRKIVATLYIGRQTVRVSSCMCLGYDKPSSLTLVKVRKHQVNYVTCNSSVVTLLRGTAKTQSQIFAHEKIDFVILYRNPGFTAACNVRLCTHTHEKQGVSGRSLAMNLATCLTTALFRPQCNLEELLSLSLNYQEKEKPTSTVIFGFIFSLPCV